MAKRCYISPRLAFPVTRTEGLGTENQAGRRRIGLCRECVSNANASDGPLPNNVMTNLLTQQCCVARRELVSSHCRIYPDNRHRVNSQRRSTRSGILPVLALASFQNMRLRNNGWVSVEGGMA
jgi:hypothetical protein